MRITNKVDKFFYDFAKNTWNVKNSVPTAEKLLRLNHSCHYIKCCLPGIKLLMKCQYFVSGKLKNNVFYFK